MSEEHIHAIRYTIYLRRHWWSTETLVIVGVGSSKQGDELLIKCQDGAFHSVNYANVIRMVAEPVQ